MLISVDQLKKSESRYKATENTSLRTIAGNLPDEMLIDNVSPEVTAGNILSEDENLEKRKQMLDAKSIEPTDFAFERTIGENDSVYSNFVTLILNAKKKVGRIVIKQDITPLGKATGFMVAPNLLLTNWHVFKTVEAVGGSEIQFGYELDTNGNEISPVCFKLDSKTFFYSNQELDYCFVAVNPVDIDGKVNLSSIGYIFLDPSLGKLGMEGKEELNIIHHPNGDYMQLSIRENLFTKITPISVWYESDTAPGSSGSPVFNDQWQIVALHHMGVAKKNENGDYIDKDGNVIPVINGKIDSNKVVWIANEGIRISVILKDIISKLPDSPFVKNLNIIPSSFHEKQDENVNSPFQVPQQISKIKSMENNTEAANVHISFPPSLIEKNGVININISQGQSLREPLPVKSLQPTSLSDTELDEQEIKRLEQSIDYSLCRGYQSRFLGAEHDVPMPMPGQDLKKFIAKLSGTDSIVLKYFNYSTIFHSVRMMPVISAINVDGDPAKRQDHSPRKDIWLRDIRLNFDIQLDDNYYKKSGFDRGHMSRREDANWGATPEEAKRNADLTCMYTNACPQVAKLNQGGRGGLWGILEGIVLESGATLETGKTAKISVFNGPVFLEDDPVFRGIQVPLNFYKIVLWLTDNDKLKATAFKLSQTELVGNIDFEELDINENTRFKQFQCSIKSLQDATKMDFSAITPFDTFEGAAGEEVEIQSDFEVMAHLNKVKSSS